MKQLLLLFSLLIFSCSANTEEDLQTEEKATHYVYIFDVCPDFTTTNIYGVNDSEFAKVNTTIKASNEYCIIVSFTDVKKRSISGYYGGQE